jgi:hypothetical protein
VNLRTDGRYVVEDRGYETPCWVWQLRIDTYGYGRVHAEPAHRVSYEERRGPIPAGLTLDHLCRVRECINPDHLEPVTNGENILRGESFSARNARKTHCPNGHPLSGANLRVEANGARRCKTCRVSSERRRYLRKKAEAA